MPDSTDKAQVITTRLHEILDKVDMQITSERQIINKLAEELGDDVYDHKALIKVNLAPFKHPVLLRFCHAARAVHVLLLRRAK